VSKVRFGKNFGLSKEFKEYAGFTKDNG